MPKLIVTESSIRQAVGSIAFSQTIIHSYVYANPFCESVTVLSNPAVGSIELLHCLYTKEITIDRIVCNFPQRVRRYSCCTNSSVKLRRALGQYPPIWVIAASLRMS